MKMKPLIMYRMRGISGPRFQNAGATLTKSVGNFIGHHHPRVSSGQEISNATGTAEFVTEASSISLPTYIVTD